MCVCIAVTVLPSCPTFHSDLENLLSPWDPEEQDDGRVEKRAKRERERERERERDMRGDGEEEGDTQLYSMVWLLWQQLCYV